MVGGGCETKVHYQPSTQSPRLEAPAIRLPAEEKRMNFGNVETAAPR